MVLRINTYAFTSSHVEHIVLKINTYALLCF